MLPKHPDDHSWLEEPVLPKHPCRDVLAKEPALSVYFL